MNLNITGHHLEITPAIREYVVSKFARVLRHVDNVVDASVILSVEPLKHKAEVTLRIPGKDIHAEALEENLYAAIDILTDKTDRLVLKHKEKQKVFSSTTSAKELNTNA